MTLEERLTETIRLLRQCEWRELDAQLSTKWCPVCFNSEKVGHKHGCKMAEILGRPTVNYVDGDGYVSAQYDPPTKTLTPKPQPNPGSSIEAMREEIKFHESESKAWVNETVHMTDEDWEKLKRVR